MTYLWTKAEISQILLQLEQKGCPFPKYSFLKNGTELCLLGQGSYALVFDAEKKQSKTPCAIKVIGFGDQQALPDNFQSVLERQKQLSWESRHIVRIYDYTQLRIWIDSHNCVTDVQPLDKAKNSGQYIDLQFIVMEKLSPVLSTKSFGQPQLFSQALTDMDEPEILHLAKDIADALQHIHAAGMLHRDVKLENLFYDSRKKTYKLGDFGIAAVSKNGMASTVAFTKGYGAPEIISSCTNRYDCTADIYSLGILLYVLLNGLRFPGSSGYFVNAEVQYQKGSLLPPPVCGANELFPIIEKMCRYLPDDRYQTMDAVIDQFYAVQYNPLLHYRDAHKSISYIIGLFLLGLGTISYRVSFPPERVPVFSAELCLLLVLGAICTLLEKGKRNGNIIRFFVFGIGVHYLIFSGFTWIKLILLLFFAYGADLTGVLEILFLSWYAGGYFGSAVSSAIYEIAQQKWCIPSFYSLGVVFLFQYFSLETHSWINNYKLTRNLLWKEMILLYGTLIALHLVMRYIPAFLIMLLGQNVVTCLLSWELHKCGILGIAVSVLWLLRERAELRRSV